VVFYVFSATELSEESFSFASTVLISGVEKSSGESSLGSNFIDVISFSG